MKIQDELKEYLLSQGASDVGFCLLPDGDFGECKYAVSVAVRLSDAVVDEIGAEPTHTYFNHYRSVNSFIDSLLLKAGLFLQNKGYRYITVAASQSINKDGWNYKGRYSHKKAACLAGLGTVGKSSMFLHKKYGARVRLGTLVTDCPFETEKTDYVSPCLDCDMCVKACPSGAILGKLWDENTTREEMFDPEKCSNYMKNHFKHIGRGAVCGICMRVCPYGK
ncbi:MAG: epoxyqueuosine reductase [Clostridia bacterium]|nr:epoxyqueuosine reductase [Clostridia bacterium]